MTRDASILPAVRAEVVAAHDALARACGKLRRAGFPDTTEDLERARRLVGTWTAPGGYLEHIEKGAANAEGDQLDT